MNRDDWQRNNLLRGMFGRNTDDGGGGLLKGVGWRGPIVRFCDFVDYTP